MSPEIPARLGTIRKALGFFEGINMMTTETDGSLSRRPQSCYWCCALLVAMVGVLPVLRPASAEPSDKIDARRAKILAGKTAWQADEKLEEKWRAITGRFIFQRVCLDCHDEGPRAFTPEEWQRNLKGFPGGMHPELPAFYSDLTATFNYGRMVPNDSGRLEALTTFLLKATAKDDSQEEYGEVNLFPAVGEEAPVFEIKDTNGSTFQLTSLRGKKNLVLVFSRAHW